MHLAKFFQEAAGTWDVEKVLTGIGALIAVIVSLVVAATAAKQSAFTQLEGVVKSLRDELTETKEELKDAKKELREAIERSNRFERWAYRLVNQLEAANIVPVKLDDEVTHPD